MQEKTSEVSYNKAYCTIYADKAFTTSAVQLSKLRKSSKMMEVGSWKKMYQLIMYQEMNGGDIGHKTARQKMFNVIPEFTELPQLNLKTRNKCRLRILDKLGIVSLFSITFMFWFIVAIVKMLSLLLGIASARQWMPSRFCRWYPWT